MNAHSKNPPRLALTLFALALAVVIAPALRAQVPQAPPPTELPGLRFTNDFFPGTTYDRSVPAPESLLGFPLAQRAATPAEIERCLKAWTAAATNRTRLVEYARTYESRPLHYVVVTAPRNLSRLEEIREGLAKLGDPRKLTDAEAGRLTNSLPPVAWLAYTIHGDETEGSDAALVVLHHLIAAQDPKVQKLLEEVVVIIDPLMNPDGRERFLKMVAENRGTAPNVDDQSLLHAGYWPRGRGNHYLFDLNRDWIVGAHPETRGRIREVGRWNPQLFVDGHGMGAQETHLFSPPREPVNPNIPKEREDWGNLFARDQAAAFDRQHLLYYTGEWHEEWFPGYSDGWASYRGAIGILYEQARIAEDGVRRPGGRILSYRESVLHHVTGTMANLTTLQANARPLLGYYYASRKAAVDPAGPYANRTFAVLPTANRSRLQDLVELLQLEGFEVFQADQPFTAAKAVDQLGRDLKDLRVPAGTLLVPNRQPLGRLLAAMLEFDPRFSAKVLADERQELLRKGQTRIYDTTAWNLSMMHGLEAVTLAMEPPASAKPVTAVQTTPAPANAATASPVAWVIDGADDLSVTAAARLMERGVQVRVAEKPFRFDDRDFVRGSVMVTPLDNRMFAGALAETVTQALAELNLPVVAVRTGLGEKELPDIGGRFFRRLEPPRIALFGREGFSTGDYGSAWYVLDHHLGVRHSQIDDGRGVDLSRYNVVILPDRGGASTTELSTNLKEWVRAGGTLIAISGSATPLIAEKAEFSKVRALPEVLGRLPEYELAVLREWLGRTGALPSAEAIWSYRPGTELRYPWQAVDGAHPDEKELKRRDAWQALFMPEGALLAGRVDTNHWLTAGCGDLLPLLVGRQPILMAADGVEAPIRYGYLTPVAKAPGASATPEPATAPAAADPKEPARKDKDKKEAPRVGWSALPEGTEMHLRMSGLLWPEASHRLANAAWVTRESLGRGQIILFATPPTFRAATRGTTRVFLNAVVCGPGFGAAQPVRP